MCKTMEVCLQCLPDVDRHIANGEVLGTSLQLEEFTEQADSQCDEALSKQ